MRNTTSSILILFVTAVLVGVLVGAVMAAVGSVVYLVLIFPIASGLAAGNVVGRMARTLHVRQSQIVRAMGALSGLVTMIVLLTATWSIDRSELVMEVTTRLGGSDAMVTRTLELWNRDATGGAPIIVAPVMYRLHSGLELFEAQRLNLGLGFNLAILLLEGALAALGAWRFASELVSDPYCERCCSWTSRRIVGTATLGAVPTIKSELKMEQWHRLGRRIGAPTLGAPVTLNCFMCDTCESMSVLFELDVQESGKRFSTVMKKPASYSALQDIWDSQDMARGKI